MEKRTEDAPVATHKVGESLSEILERGKGKLAERAKTKEFEVLTEAEIGTIENKYQEIFH